VPTGTLSAQQAKGGAGMLMTTLEALGGTPDPAKMARRARVSSYHDGAFHNTAQPRWVPPSGDLRNTVREFLSNGASRRPSGPIPLVPVADPVSGGGLHVTWYGHASSLVEVDGGRFLLDPVWGERVSPVSRVGPRRLHPVPHELSELGQLDAVVISHDHYDHLDLPTVQWLREHSDAPFVVPLGVGAHLRRWRVPAERIVELDWTESVELAGVRLTATQGRHFTGRSFSRNPTLWASWVLAGPQRKVFYTGDSGYFDGYAAIGAEHGPFDAALVQVGAYNVSWPDVHMTPEEGVAAHRDLRGGLLIPVHWGTFNLAPHPWAEPAVRVLAAAEEAGVPLVIPKPGERIDVGDPPAVDQWWRALARAAA
jgi:L-ascorbate metabolism protein UlaG (beta-lactamase superfamily)